jgi:hypothetical protein
LVLELLEVNIIPMRIFLIVVISFFSFSFYGQNDTLAVIKHTDRDIVFPKDLKVVYRGVYNFLHIEVPNCKSFEASAPGLKFESKNQYFFIAQSGPQVIIKVVIILKSNKQVVENHIFKIKNTSGFISTINYKGMDENSIVRMQKQQFKDAKVRVRFTDKNLVFSNEVVAFALKIPGQPSIHVDGSRIDNNTYERILKNAVIGDQITISEIKMKVTEESLRGASCFLTSPIVIEIY